MGEPPGTRRAPTCPDESCREGARDDRNALVASGAGLRPGVRAADGRLAAVTGATGDFVPGHVTTEGVPGEPVGPAAV